MSITQISDSGYDLYKREILRSQALHVELGYYKRVMAIDNRKLSSTSKIIFLAVRERVHILSCEHDDHVHVYRGELASDTGLSKDVISKALADLHKVGLIDLTWEWDEEARKKGQKKKLLLIALTLLSDYPEDIAVNAPDRNHGGERQTCKHCGSDRLSRRTVIECKNCGKYQGPPIETDVNGPDPLDMIDLPRTPAPEPRDTDELPSARIPETPMPVLTELPKLSEEDDEPTEKRPAHRPPYRPELKILQTSTVRPAKPTRACSLCWRDKQKTIVSWTWKVDDNEYCCNGCFSPFSWSERERERAEREDIRWTPF